MDSRILVGLVVGSGLLFGAGAGSFARHRYMSLSRVERWVPEMRRLGVSEVARSPRGFLTAYRKAGGDPNKLPEAWRARREAFIARHMAQVRKNKEPLCKNGKPTRRHLALIAWAYSPRT